MQFNRLHKVVSARACEYIFILRQSYVLIKNEFITSCFPKKNFFTNIEAELTQKLGELAVTKTNAMLNA